MFPKILVAVDGSSYSDMAFDVAMGLTKSLNAQVIAVHVVPDSIPMEGLSPEDLASIDRENRREGESLLLKYNAMAKDQYDREIETILVKGHAGHKIVDVSLDKSVNLVVVGHRGRGKLKELLLGSVSNHVVHNSKVSVLVVK